MSIQYEVSAKVGQDKTDKPVYRKIGVVIKTQKGYMLKLETIPVIGWDGWAYLNPPQEKSAAPAPKKQGGSFDDIEEDIQF